MGLAKKFRKKKAKQQAYMQAVQRLKEKEKFKNMKTTEKESYPMSETSVEGLNES